MGARVAGVGVSPSPRDGDPLQERTAIGDHARHILDALQSSLLRRRTAAMSHPAFACDQLHIISQHPQASANWYVQMCGADLVADTVACGAPQIVLERGGKTLIIRGPRPSEAPTAARARPPSADDSSHHTWGTDPFGFLDHGDWRAFCDELRAQGVRVPVPLKAGVGGRWRCDVAAPDGVSLERMPG
jgi:catechol 2,3-dioxygenase-like lactoylglutathione lyase family enzyme